MRRVGEIVITHDQAAGIRYGGEFVHLAAIDLSLLLIEAMHQIAGRDIAWHIAIDLEGRIRQLRREPRIDHRRVEVAVHNRRQVIVGPAVAIGLHGGLSRRVQPVGAGKQPEHIVEAAVLLEDHDDVADAGQRGAGRGRLRHRRVSTETCPSNKGREQHAMPKMHRRSPSSSASLSGRRFIRWLITVL